MEGSSFLQTTQKSGALPGIYPAPLKKKYSPSSDRVEMKWAAGINRAELREMKSALLSEPIPAQESQFEMIVFDGVVERDKQVSDSHSEYQIGASVTVGGLIFAV